MLTDTVIIYDGALEDVVSAVEHFLNKARRVVVAHSFEGLAGAALPGAIEKVFLTGESPMTPADIACAYGGAEVVRLA